MSLGFPHYPKLNPLEVHQEEVPKESVHPEEVPREEDCIPKPREEEVRDTQRAEEMTAAVTPEGDTSNRTQTGVSMKAMTGKESHQELVGPLDQQATREEIMK